MRHHPFIFKLAALIFAMGVATSSHAKSVELPDISKLPRAVQKTVKEQVGDGKIVKIQKETLDHRVAYGVACAKGDRKWHIEVAPNGKLLVRAEEMTLSNLTTAVQATIQQNAADGKIESIANVTEGGQSYYAVAASFNGQEKTFIIGEDGKLIDTQIPENQMRAPEITDTNAPPPGELKGGGYPDATEPIN